jgi:hypothetical protein
MRALPASVTRLVAALPALLVAAVAALAVAGAPVGAADWGPADTLTASVTPAETALGGGATVAGTVGRSGTGVGGVPLVLQGDPYPYAGFADIARTTSLADGSFSFPPLRPDRNERLRVLGEGAPALASATLSVLVDPLVSLSARSLGPGRALLSLRIRHVRDGGPAPVAVRWFVRTLSARVYRQAAVTPSSEVRPGLLVASAVVDPPARRFSFRVCLNPPWEAAMGPAGAHGRCPRGDFSLGSGDARR